MIAFSGPKTLHIIPYVFILDIASLLLKKNLRAIFRYDDTETLPCLLLWRPSGKRVKTEGPDAG
jgi:hypothetical protein